MNKKNILFYLLLLSTISGCSQNDSTKLNVDTLEFQVGYPTLKSNALQQLRDFRSPRYKPDNHFMRIFNWMDPTYAGGQGQEGLKSGEVIKEGAEIQEELAINWNYFIVIPNSILATNEATYKNRNSPLRAYTDLANKHPEIPLGVTTFWQQIRPNNFGSGNKTANIVRKDFPDAFYIRDTAKYLRNKTISFAAPDSLFINDGHIQKMYLQTIVNHLTRPINLINENGEEPPWTYSEKFLRQDQNIIADKNKLKIDSWSDYIAIKKKHFRKLYTSQFLDSIPQLKNTGFSIYQNEGGPIDRFDWNISKSTSTKINGYYYSTSDYYPRTPGNWKKTKGPWHGWDWIDLGRKVEIKAGDRFFSPFVAAGWAHNPEADIRPAQWLGLLKCMTVVGAEFFYTGYFNEKKPFSKPENYIWQAAIPSYAQAIATHFNDLFRNGNVLFDKKGEPIITYPDDDKEVLITVRKSNNKDQFVIAATVQTNSNRKRSPLEKNVTINLENENIKLNARRQGSVYIYDKTVSPAIFYQLDRWHEHTHPERWRKYWINEAEVFDSSGTTANQLIKCGYSKINDTIDFSKAEAWILLNEKQWVNYTLYSRDFQHLKNLKYLFILAKSDNSIEINMTINGIKNKIESKKTKEWKWIKYPLNMNTDVRQLTSTMQFQSLGNKLYIDKIVITDTETIPDLMDY